MFETYQKDPQKIYKLQNSVESEWVEAERITEFNVYKMFTEDSQRDFSCSNGCVRRSACQVSLVNKRFLDLEESSMRVAEVFPALLQLVLFLRTLHLNVTRTASSILPALEWQCSFATSQFRQLRTLQGSPE